jgi:hypothetical protein
MSPVDVAVCVMQDLPTVEAFLAQGVVPSEEAVALAEKATPIMR